jgi:hypothetical protein
MSTLILAEYLADVARDMRAKSAAIRRDFASHRPSAGDNREDLVESFLSQHLPNRFGVSTGMVISAEGVFSNQADLVVVDDQNNAPLYAATRNKLWPAEAVAALIEVKTTLGPGEIADAVAKARRFKTLRRSFCDAGQITQRITDSLFVLWGFDAPSAETFKVNLTSALAEIPRAEQPDLIIVPDRLVAVAGTYLELSTLGQPSSPYRNQLAAQHGADLSALLPSSNQVAELGENSLLAGYVWLDSWLRQSGNRLADPTEYLPPNLGLPRML